MNPSCVVKERIFDMLSYLYFSYFLGSVEKVPEINEGLSNFTVFSPLSPTYSFQNLPFMCQHCPLIFFLSGTSAPEWIGFQEAEYKFFDHRTTWEQAQRICTWFDSSLASVHSADEQTFLANTLRKAQCT